MIIAAMGATGIGLAVLAGERAWTWWVHRLMIRASAEATPEREPWVYHGARESKGDDHG